jgi:putative ABC transport system permease protein
MKINSDFFETISESFYTLTLNKLRTGLAMLGIVIGIGSVIALLSLGQATQKQIEENIQSLGANLLTVLPGSQRSGSVMGAPGEGTSLTLKDARAIEDSSSITTISRVSPEVSSRAQIATGKNNTNAQVIGVTANYAPVHKIETENGSFINDAHDKNMSKVVVLGPQIVEDLFGTNAEAVGKTIRIAGQTFTIIGVTVSKGGSGFMNSDNIAYVPLSTAQKQLFGQDYLSSIALEAKSSDVMTQAQNEVGYFLLARHKLSSAQDADFRIMSQQDILNTVSETAGTFTTLLSGIAAISLLVGGIGIMNIMLVTVTERTREIGLRKALGATKKNIIQQFLTEAIILTFMGGIIGMVVGIIVFYFISKIGNFVFTVSPMSIILAIAVSGIIGIVFGWYPAKRASDLQPIEALRYE